jgi:hypothetical protein
MKDNLNLDLLIEWEERFKNGEDVPARVLCQDCPEHIEAVEEGIRFLKQTKWIDSMLGC